MNIWTSLKVNVDLSGVVPVGLYHTNRVPVCLEVRYAINFAENCHLLR